jgi:2-keto-4-pentenoate hydratase/2-oxohepta-3-ene-1,7-dioic acid hydratase in catechol pathway
MKSVYLDGDKICPSKIVCIGRNYVDHIKELGNETPSEPVIFLKPNSAISGEIRSNKKDLIHYEAEMTFVVKSGELSAVGFGLDLTKREVQSGLRSKGLPWERSKAFDGSAVFSDFVTITAPITELRLELYINDHLVQQGGYALMMNKPQEVLDETEKFLSYEDGDLIMTGTPKGVGPVNADDRFVGKIFVKDRLLLEHYWVVQ